MRHNLNPYDLELRNTYRFYIVGETVVYNRTELYPYYSLDIERSQTATIQTIQKAYSLLYADVGGLI